MINDVYIAGAARTPIGDFMGGLSGLSSVELGKIACAEAVHRAGADKSDIEEVVCGMIYKGGMKGNPGRQIQLGIGLPEGGWASTIDQQCGSGMKAVEMLSQQIALGKTRLGLAVGIESMSNAGYVLKDARKIRMGDVKLVDTITHDGLICAMCDYHMGITAENLAEKYGITREEQDRLAVLSNERATAAQKAGRLAGEIVPVTIKSRKGDTVVSTDEHPKEVSFEKLAKLRPAFQKDGTVTAGNASGINDGAAARPWLRINSTMQVDLYGQLNSTAVGPQLYSGIGGQVDFVRGARRSKGGESIIALPSTAKGGTISKVVARLDPGAAVTTSRYDVGYVVTEHGIADLYGLNLRERARALIEIAHPDFREALEKEAWETKNLR